MTKTKLSTVVHKVTIEFISLMNFVGKYSVLDFVVNCSFHFDCVVCSGGRNCGR